MTIRIWPVVAFFDLTPRLSGKNTTKMGTPLRPFAHFIYIVSVSFPFFFLFGSLSLSLFFCFLFSFSPSLLLSVYFFLHFFFRILTQLVIIRLYSSMYRHALLRPFSDNIFDILAFFLLLFLKLLSAVHLLFLTDVLWRFKHMFFSGLAHGLPAIPSWKVS